MKQLEKTFIKGLTVFLFGIALFVSIGLAVWFWPRQAVLVADNLQTTESMYFAEQQITVTGRTQTNLEAPANFDVRLICNNIKYNYGSATSLNVKKQIKPVSYSFTYPAIPTIITNTKPFEKTCNIEVTARYSLEILPFMTRQYYHTFVSNEFIINSEE